MQTSDYLLFIDESGRSTLKDKTKFFVLSTVLIGNNDYSIIEGYLRLLKRKFFNDDLKPLHACDLFEKPKLRYPELFSGQKPQLNSFIDNLDNLLSNIPYQVGLYYIDKDTLKTKGIHISKNPNKPTNWELPYEKCSLEAINDFTSFLVNNDKKGELVIESRLFKDSDFVSYFDSARKHLLGKNIVNNLALEVKKRINCLSIGNKLTVNAGLEIADICGYVTYKTLYKNPDKLAIKYDFVLRLYNTFKKRAYVKSPNGLIKKDMT